MTPRRIEKEEKPSLERMPTCYFSKAAKEQPRTEDGTRVTEKVTGATTSSGTTCARKNKYAGSAAKAKMSKTNRRGAVGDREGSEP
mgnify:CR=1 FL=1